jgi:hypothetical protein
VSFCKSASALQARKKPVQTRRASFSRKAASDKAFFNALLISRPAWRQASGESENRIPVRVDAAQAPWDFQFVSIFV